MGFIEITAFLITGFLLGLKHSIDSDHLVAVTALVSKSQELRKSLIQGAFWAQAYVEYQKAQTDKA